MINTNGRQPQMGSVILHLLRMPSHPSISLSRIMHRTAGTPYHGMELPFFVVMRTDDIFLYADGRKFQDKNIQTLWKSVCCCKTEYGILFTTV